MPQRSTILTGLVLLTILPLLASCGQQKEMPPPEPTEKPEPVETKPVPEPPQATEREIDPDRQYDFRNIHFEFDKYRLTPAAQKLLTEHAQVLMRNKDWKVRIEGHCDERGTVEYNLALGEERADAAKDFLVRYGVTADRIKTVSYGKERPIDPRHNEEAWAKNRRDEFHVDR